MPLSKEQINSVEKVLKVSLRNKFKEYKPEADAKPFQTRLLGQDRLALYAFIHSLNTNFGTTVFEPVAKVIAEKRFSKVEIQMDAPKYISLRAQGIIQNIMDDLISGIVSPNKKEEIIKVKKVSKTGESKKVKLTKIDIYLETEDKIYMIDIKAAKPNFGEFKGFKRTLLEWTAAKYLESSTKKEIISMIAIPY